MAKLNALRVKRLSEPGRYGDGDGLWLQVRAADSKSWLFRYRFGGKARQMGLGPEDKVTLAEARDLARDAAKLVRQGVDPIVHRQQQRSDITGAKMTFRMVAEAYITAHRAGWKSDKHAAQWGATLERYAYPVIGDKPITDVAVGDVMKILQPIWHTTTETASRVRGRIESILDFARAQEWREGDNPARWRGHLKNLLPARARVAKVEHHPALPWVEIAEFMALLRDRKGAAARALAFTILTAARTGETLGAVWGEIDRKLKIWTVPPIRMKGGVIHRVPLSEWALAILDSLRPPGKLRPDAFIFPGMKPGRPLCNMSMMAVLRRMEFNEITVHGFRSSFRDWCSEATSHAREVAEAALAHAIESDVESAYRRGDLLAKRAKLMAEWAAFCGHWPAANNVIDLDDGRVERSLRG